MYQLNEVNGHKCHPLAICKNIPGKYECECKQGYQGDGRSCNDVNECAKTPNPCNDGSICVNKPGTYQCGCPDGFSGPDSQGNCNDIDECEKGVNGSPACASKASCANSEGGYQCTCNSGFKGNPKDKCHDIDECKTNPNICPGISECKNNYGGYKCNCPEGYTGSASKCRDVDECADRKSKVCGSSPAICTNKPGNFECSCPDGYKWVESTETGKTGKCVDIDECLGMNSWNTPCDRTGGVCENTVGGFECSCKTGFKGDGKSCEDVDECLDETVCPGDPDQVICINSVGSYECKQITCPPTAFADVALVLDTHTQIGPYNLKFVQQFAQKFIEGMEIASNATAITVMAYSSEKVTPTFFLTDARLQGKAGALASIQRLKHAGYGLRLERPLSFLLNFSFLPAMGRNSDRPGIAVVVSGAKTDSLASLKAIEGALRRSEKEKNLRFIAVGVEDAVEEEMMLVAGAKKKKNVLMLNKWQDLPDNVEKVMNMVCRLSKQ